jgi:uncharacterized protein
MKSSIRTEAFTIKDFVPSAARAGRGMLPVMDSVTDSDGPALEYLSRDECMRLMASVPVGRIVFTRRALPAVELVNFALNDGDIIIRTHAEGKLAAATHGAVVAFETDSLDLAGHAGWSVTIVGKSRAVTDSEEILRLEQIALSTCAPGKRDHFIRISPAIVNGQRVGTGRPRRAP